MAAINQVAAFILWAQVFGLAQAACRRPVVPSGVGVDLLEVEEVTVAYFYCEDPNLNPDPEQWICNSGSWDHTQVVCKGQECADPPAVEHGQVRTLNKSRGGMANYTCNPGYRLEGRSNLICRRERSGEFVWKPNPPRMTCQADFADGDGNSCGIPSPVDNARHDGGRGREVFPAGHRLQYTCGPGFIQSGAGQSTCKAGQWIPPHITCTPRNCGDPGRPNNGRRIGSVHTFGSQVTFQCNEGFQLSGPRITFCQANAQWSSSRPNCSPVKCPVVHTPDHGSTFGSSREYRAELKVSCENGYMVQGTSVPQGSKEIVLTCQAAGTWDVWPVQCVEVDCGHITEYFPFGTMNEQGTRWRSMVTFRCNADATMSGSDTSECKENAQWSYPPPVCWGKCRKPDVPNGKVTKYKLKTDHYFRTWNIPNTMENGTLIGITCNWKHDLQGSGVVHCHNKTWEYLPSCVPRPCDSLKPVGQGMTVTHSGTHLEGGTGKVPHKTSATLTCAFGYTGTGSRRELYTVCDLGTWTQNANYFRCTPNPCPKLTGTGEGVEIRQPSADWKGFISHGSEASLSCKQGYSGIGGKRSMISTCNLGIWSGNPNGFTCTANPCQRLIARMNINIYYDKEEAGGHLDSGTWATLSCWQGFTASTGTKQITSQCLLGIWTNNPAGFECLPDPCNILSGQGLKLINWNTQDWKTAHGKVKHNTQVTLSCDDGYISSDGSRQLITRCKKGSWTGKPDRFKCKEKSCKALAHRINTHVIYTNTFGHSILVESDDTEIPPSSTLTLTCDDGYSLSDSVEMGTMCIRGKWAPDVPDYPCILTSCPAIPYDDYTELAYSPNTGWHTENERVKEDTTVQADCLPGYVQQSNNSIECQAGIWKPHPDTILCHPRGCNAIDHSNLTQMEGPVKEGQHPHDSVFRVTCQQGYHLNPSGKSNIQCDNGDWNNNVTCDPNPCVVVLDDTVFTAAQNGVFLQNGTQFPHKDTVVVNCIEAQYQYNATCIAGKWAPEIPSCSAEKCDLPPLSNGLWVYADSSREVTDSSVWPQSQVQPKCVNGYQLIGNMTGFVLSCKKDGNWIEASGNAVCEPATCRLPAKIPNGKYMDQHVSLIMSVRDSPTWYQCYGGFTPVSGEETPRSTSVICDHGQIKPAEPACLKDCTLPEIHGHYESDVSSLKHGSNTTYQCSPSDEWTPVQCDNGTLIPAPPACEPTGCDSANTCIDMADGCRLSGTDNFQKKTFQNIGVPECREKCFTYSDFTCNSANYRKEWNYCTLYDGWASQISCTSNSTDTWTKKYILLRRQISSEGGILSLADCSLQQIDGSYNGQPSNGPISLKHGTNTTYLCASSAPGTPKYVRCENGTLLPSEPNCHQTDCYSDKSCIKMYEHCLYEDITLRSKFAYIWETTLQDCKKKCSLHRAFTCKTAQFNRDRQTCIISDAMIRSDRVRCHGNHTTDTTYQTTLLERSWSQDCTSPSSFPNGYWHIQHGSGGTRNRIYFCCNEGFILKGSPVLECQGPVMNETTLPHCEFQQASNRLDASWGGNQINNGLQTFQGAFNVVVDCNRYQHLDVEWVFVNGTLNPGKHESSGHQINFRSDSPMQGNVTYMCTHWYYKISKCITLQFTND